NAGSKKEPYESVHLADLPEYHAELVDKDLEERMALAQDISSLTLSLRKKTGINVRQPLNKILVPVLDSAFQEKVEKVKELILSETNIKAVSFITDTAGIIKKKIKPNFKVLGAKVGKDMKTVVAAIQGLGDEQIAQLESTGSLALAGTPYHISPEDVEIIAEDVAGWQVANLGKLTVALDIQITPELKQEGLSRELINRIQNLRKDKGFEVTDRIRVTITQNPEIQEAVENNLSYICTEILADAVDVTDASLETGDTVEIDGQELRVIVKKIN